MKIQNNSYQAYYVRESNNEFKGTIENLPLENLHTNDTLIRVSYSSLNYKDALSATGNKGVTRNYPHTPGIDAVGTVVESIDSLLVGKEVIVTGNDLGMNTSGGYADYISVPKEWVVPLPEGLTMAESMMYGTAGFTAALSVYKLHRFIQPEDGPILVTGATGGVGSIAVRLLSHLNYDVVAVSSKTESYAQLEEFGAKEIISRQALLENSNKPLLKGRYAGVIDSVGGDFLSTVLKYVKMNGVVTCCGNIRGQEFTASIFPFILRGIQLQGITSASCDYTTRIKIWELLSTKWHLMSIHDQVTTISLNELNDYIPKILKGQLKGRTIIKI
ncbi:MAG: YhdH/YhfP family quinone oxidoreductase [Clostridiales bacterium]|nr:YhdH/YhfP family quinone oxidoreductase [Clostridiales bacterium]